MRRETEDCSFYPLPFMPDFSLFPVPSHLIGIPRSEFNSRRFFIQKEGNQVGNKKGEEGCDTLPAYFSRQFSLKSKLLQYNDNGITGRHPHLLLHEEIYNLIPVFQCANDRRLSELNIKVIFPNHPQRNDQVIKFSQIIGFKIG